MIFLTTTDAQDLVFAIMTRIKWISEFGLSIGDTLPKSQISYANEVIRLAKLLEGFGFPVDSTTDINGGVAATIVRAREILGTNVVPIFSDKNLLTTLVSSTIVEKSDQETPEEPPNGT